ncbi:MAG TPA: AAA family ATPase [Pseudomonadota bacterium]|nr:AAA family ATPase [Pseudomonadota bacterium]
MEKPTSPLIKTLHLSNYRSLAEHVSIPLGPLSVLVGKNDSGKSNVLDAIRFLREAALIGVSKALVLRGGLESVRRRDSGPAESVRIGIEFFSAASPDRWECLLQDGEHRHAPPILGLVAADGALRNGTRRDFIDDLRCPRKSAAITPPLSAESWPSVLVTLSRSMAGLALREALGRAIADITDYRVTNVGGFLEVEFCHGADDWAKVDKESDGTLWFAYLATALLAQPARTMLLVEEPESLLSASAIDVLSDLLSAASRRMQIVVSTHSPHLLSRCHPDQILVVERKSATTVRPLEGRQRELVLAGTVTLGDLMLAEDLRQEPIVPQA